MLRQPILRGRTARVPAPATRRSDHAMDVLQYGTAALAIAVAVFLMAIR